MNNFWDQIGIWIAAIITIIIIINPIIELIKRFMEKRKKNKPG